MLLPKYGPNAEDGQPPLTLGDWGRAICLVATAALGVFAIKAAMRDWVFAPGSALQQFFVTERPVDGPLIGAVSTILALAALVALLCAFGAEWIRHPLDGAPTQFRRWQLLNLFVYVLGQSMVTSNIRLDTGRRVPSFFSLFTPVPWAFGIWGVIFLGEAIFVIYQALPPQRSNTLLAALSPYWIAAQLFQLLWCFIFCPYAQPVLYLSSLFLGGVAVALGGAYLKCTSWHALFLPDRNWAFWALAQVPLTLHFGWMCAAVLVNLNASLARAHFPVHVQLAAATGALYAATALGVALTLARRDALYGLTVAWAVNGVRCGNLRCLSNEDCLAAFPGIGTETLEAQVLMAACLTVVLLVVSGLVLLRHLARLLLLDCASFETRDAILRNLPTPVLTYLE